MIRFLQGDALRALRTLPAESVHTCITSPPYWSLRKYSDDPDEMGREATFEEHVDRLLTVFAEMKRTMRSDATFWFNYGDQYAGVWRGRQTSKGWKRKDLMMMPARIAIAMQESGWHLRSEIIWVKPNPIPDSAKDRPATQHEKIYLFSKRKHYYYDGHGVRQPPAPATIRRLSQPGFDLQRGGPKDGKDGGPSHRKSLENLKRSFSGRTTYGRHTLGENLPETVRRGHWRSHQGLADLDKLTKAEQAAFGCNLRNVWVVAPEASPIEHYAMFPSKLVVPMIQAGTSDAGACADCGKPWNRIVSDSEGGIRDSWLDHRFSMEKGNRMLGSHQSHSWRPGQTLGWNPGCHCDTTDDPVPCTVLDPFAGVGTVGLVAARMSRAAIQIELNPKYLEIAKNRIYDDAPLLAPPFAVDSVPAAL